MSRRKRDDDRAEDVLFGGTDNSPKAVADEIFGGSDVSLDTGRVVARPTPLDKIWFDRKQPRRLIPARVAGRWDGDPSQADTLIGRWISEARNLLGRDERLDVGAILRSEDFIDLDIEQQPFLVTSLIDVIKMALSIRDNGLTNPPTAAKRPDGRWLLHTGERRTMAHHLLRMAHEGDRSDRWQKMPLYEVEHDVWAQVNENTQRSDMTAVGYARALANLYMDMYKDERDFGDVLDFTTDDGCDRAYYAQILDLKAKSGSGDRLVSALNATSRARVSHYRKILELPDGAWVRADEENWTEGFIREFLTLPEHNQITVIDNRWTQAQILDLIKRGNQKETSGLFTTVNNTHPDAPQAPPAPPAPTGGNFGANSPQTRDAPPRIITPNDMDTSYEQVPDTGDRSYAPVSPPAPRQPVSSSPVTRSGGGVDGVKQTYGIAFREPMFASQQMRMIFDVLHHIGTTYENPENLKRLLDLRNVTPEALAYAQDDGVNIEAEMNEIIELFLAALYEMANDWETDVRNQFAAVRRAYAE